MLGLKPSSVSGRGDGGGIVYFGNLDFIFYICFSVSPVFESSESPAEQVESKSFKVNRKTLMIIGVIKSDLPQMVLKRQDRHARTHTHTHTTSPAPGENGAERRLICCIQALLR